MADEVKTEAPKVTEPKKPSPRELALEKALNDTLVLVEEQVRQLQRMGISMGGTAEWVESTKKLVNESK